MWKNLRTQFKKITHASKNKRTRTLILFPLVVVGLVLTLSVALQPQRLLQFADNAPPPPFFGCIQLGESNGTNCGTKMGSAGDVTLSLYGRPFNPAKDQVYYGDRLAGSLKYTNVGNIILRMQRLGLAGKSANGNAQFEMFPYLSNLTLAPNASATVTKASHIFNSNDTNGLYRIISKIIDNNGTELPSSDEQATQIKVNATCTALRNKELTTTDRTNLKTFCSSNPKSKLCTSKEYCQIIKGGSCPQADTNPETPGVQCDKYVYMPQPEQDMLEEFCKVYPDSDSCENFCGRTIGTKLCPKKYLYIDTSTGKPFPGDGGSNHAIYVRDPDHFKFSYSKYYPIGAVKQSQSETTSNGDSPQAVAGTHTGPWNGAEIAVGGVLSCPPGQHSTGGPITSAICEPDLPAPGNTLKCPPGQHSTGGPITSAICVPDSPDLTGGAAGGTGGVAPANPAARPVPGVPSAPRSVPVACGAPGGNPCPATLTSPDKPLADENTTLSNAFVPCDAQVDPSGPKNGVWRPANVRADESYPPSCDGSKPGSRDGAGKLISSGADIPMKCKNGQQDGCLFPCNVNKTDANGKPIQAQGWCTKSGGKPVVGQTGYDSRCSNRLREVNAADDALNGLPQNIKDAVQNGKISTLSPADQKTYRDRQFACCARSNKPTLNKNACCGDACGVWREEITGNSTTLRGAPGSNTVCANPDATDVATRADPIKNGTARDVLLNDRCTLVNDRSTANPGTGAELPNDDTNGFSTNKPAGFDQADFDRRAIACKSSGKSHLIFIPNDTDTIPMCVPDNMKCDPGQYFDAGYNGTTEQGSSPCVPIKCPSGQTYDPNSGACKGNTPLNPGGTADYAAVNCDSAAHDPSCCQKKCASGNGCYYGYAAASPILYCLDSKGLRSEDYKSIIPGSIVDGPAPQPNPSGIPDYSDVNICNNVPGNKRVECCKAKCASARGCYRGAGVSAGTLYCLDANGKSYDNQQKIYK